MPVLHGASESLVHYVPMSLSHYVPMATLDHSATLPLWHYAFPLPSILCSQVVSFSKSRGNPVTMSLFHFGFPLSFILCAQNVLEAGEVPVVAVPEVINWAYRQVQPGHTTHYP